MYFDLLTKIKNAQAVKKESIKMPYSNMDMKIAEILAANKFVESVEKKGRLPKRIIEVKLKYEADGHNGITDVKFLSTPSRRLYAGYRTFRPVRQGYGLSVVSTPKGIMTGAEARKEKVGGTLLFEVW